MSKKQNSFMSRKPSKANTKSYNSIERSINELVDMVENMKPAQHALSYNELSIPAKIKAVALARFDIKAGVKAKALPKEFLKITDDGIIQCFHEAKVWFNETGYPIKEEV